MHKISIEYDIDKPEEGFLFQASFENRAYREEVELEIAILELCKQRLFPTLQALQPIKPGPV